MYRCVMEVLKWAEPSTVLQACATVAQVWRKVTVSEELWASLLEAQCVDVADLPAPTSQVCYQMFIHFQHHTPIPLLVGTTLKLYQVGTFEREYELPSGLFDEESAAAFYLTTKLALCGKGQAGLISLTSGHFTRLPDMIARRSNHAVIALNSCLYAFGENITAERYTGQCWVALPNMLHSRSYFNVCTQHRQLYLCGGHTPCSEVFDVDTETYTPLPVVLDNNWTASFFYRGELVCLVKYKIYFVKGAQVKVHHRELALIP